MNPSGARYDALVNPGGETENPEWDGYWEAATARVSDGWIAEIRIPVQTLSFKPGLTTWHFNMQGRVQRRWDVVNISGNLLLSAPLLSLGVAIDDVVIGR